MAHYRNLEVWKRAHAQTIEIYRATRTFPSSEKFGLTSQIQRAASSIGANLAEGCGRDRDGEFARFIDIARGSCDELDYHLLLAQDLDLMTDQDYHDISAQNAEIGRMLRGLANAVRGSGRRDVRQGARS
jgi:four helix bundle protein